MIEAAYIDRLVAYGINRQWIEPEDAVFVRNLILDKLGLEAYHAPDVPFGGSLAETLSALTEYAVDTKRITNSAASRDLFDTALMGLLLPYPSRVNEHFRLLYEESPQTATDWFYAFCQDSNYIRRDRIAKDVHWKTKTEYGELDISINLAKPEKDPRDIAAARLAKQGGYPACLLCVENEGYAGRIDFPARQSLRIVPIEIAGEAWGFQYSPYVYYNEHCIVLNQKHVPMVIDRRVFEKLFSFVEQFPHYFVGSNADLPIVGGSILSHEHFQGGRYAFAMEKAPVEKHFSVLGYEDVETDVVKWPMSVIRLCSGDSERLCALAAHILAVWHSYDDPAAGILSHTADTPHNTVTPIARKRSGRFELDLVLRNNRTAAEYPMGIFHPHAELHNIKKENIGLIEVMGLAILPARLKDELALIGQMLLTGGDVAADARTAKHAEWVNRWRSKYGMLCEDTISGVIQDEVGRTFATVLEHAGVFKRNEAGKEAFGRFIEAL